jgi:hypothetical protein
MTKYYKIDGDVALDVPVPQEIDGFSREDLADLSFTPPELGLQKSAWWPAIEIEQTPAVDEKLTNELVLTLDKKNKLVEVRKVIRLKTKEEVTELLEYHISVINDAVVNATSKATQFALEYTRREAQARAYVAEVWALPEGAERPEAPRLIANFAKCAGMDDFEAAKLTIQQADMLYEKQDSLADLRMRKYEILRAPDVTSALVIAADIKKKIEEIALTIQ